MRGKQAKLLRAIRATRRGKRDWKKLDWKGKTLLRESHELLAELKRRRAAL